MSSPGGFQPSFRITHRLTAGLTRIERARDSLEAARLSEDWLSPQRMSYASHWWPVGGCSDQRVNGRLIGPATDTPTHAIRPRRLLGIRDVEELLHKIHL